MDMTITFPGGAAVDAEFKGFTVHTDQTPEHGGNGTGPQPFDLFLAALGTCAGLYALRFCQQRAIDTTGLGVKLSTAKATGAPLLRAVRLEIQLPAGFPEKYREAILRAADQCPVKRHILQPPVFELVTVPAELPQTVEV